MEKIIKAKEFCEMIGVSLKTLERLEAAGKIKPIRRNNRRYYTESMANDYLGFKKVPLNKKRINVAYYRVSTNSQKKEMQYQRNSIETFSINSGIKIDLYLNDIGSGINFKRKNFLKIIDMIENDEIDKLVITYKDRLVRFAFDLIEERCKVHNTEIIIINLKKTSPQEELVEDLMTIIHVFSSRLYGLRKYKNKIKKDLEANDNQS